VKNGRIRVDYLCFDGDRLGFFCGSGAGAYMRDVEGILRRFWLWILGYIKRVIDYGLTKDPKLLGF
jgi:hypothetical protein